MRWTSSFPKDWTTPRFSEYISAGQWVETRPWTKPTSQLIWKFSDHPAQLASCHQHHTMTLMLHSDPSAPRPIHTAAYGIRQWRFVLCNFSGFGSTWCILPTAKKPLTASSLITANSPFTHTGSGERNRTSISKPTPVTIARNLLKLPNFILQLGPHISPTSAFIHSMFLRSFTFLTPILVHPAELMVAVLRGRSVNDPTSGTCSMSWRPLFIAPSPQKSSDWLKPDTITHFFDLLLFHHTGFALLIECFVRSLGTIKSALQQSSSHLKGVPCRPLFVRVP